MVVDGVSPATIAAPAITFVYRASKVAYEIASVGDINRQLIHTIEQIVSDIDRARALRKQKSKWLDIEEKKKVDATVKSSDEAVQRLQRLVESARVDMMTRKKVSAMTRIRWVLDNSNKVDTTLAQLTANHLSLNTQITIMSLKGPTLDELQGYPHLTQSVSAGDPPPPYERALKEVLHDRRQSVAGRGRGRSVRGSTMQRSQSDNTDLQTVPIALTHSTASVNEEGMLGTLANPHQFFTDADYMTSQMRHIKLGDGAPLEMGDIEAMPLFHDQFGSNRDILVQEQVTPVEHEELTKLIQERERTPYGPTRSNYVDMSLPIFEDSDMYGGDGGSVNKPAQSTSSHSNTSPATNSNTTDPNPPPKQRTGGFFRRRGQVVSHNPPRTSTISPSIPLYPSVPVATSGPRGSVTQSDKFDLPPRSTSPPVRLASPPPPPAKPLVPQKTGDTFMQSEVKIPGLKQMTLVKWKEPGSDAAASPIPFSRDSPSVSSLTHTPSTSGVVPSSKSAAAALRTANRQRSRVNWLEWQASKE